jgi:hypothetical protein
LGGEVLTRQFGEYVSLADFQAHLLAHKEKFCGDYRPRISLEEKKQ